MIFMVYFETERLVLRSWTQEDLPLFVAMNKDEEVMRYFPSTLSDEETTALYERIQDEFRRNGWGLYA
ncbi:MAG: GNAT family N-acetyltransferase, partial [Duncaniella sp.]|nr:GNAT family N-acetyltransferase [Duncaniella sp.]